MTGGDWAALAGSIAVVLTALVGAATYMVGRQKTRAETELTKAHVRKAIAEEEAAAQRAQLEAIAGDIATQFEAVNTKIDLIQHEVTPNHGGSMKDALRRVEEGMTHDREESSRYRAEQREWRSSIGHQLGEIKDQQIRESQDRQAVDSRLQALDRRAQSEHASIWDALRTHHT